MAGRPRRKTKLAALKVRSPIGNLWNPDAGQLSYLGNDLHLAQAVCKACSGCLTLPAQRNAGLMCTESASVAAMRFAVVNLLHSAISYVKLWQQWCTSALRRCM